MPEVGENTNTSSRKTYADVLTGEMVFYALLEYLAICDSQPKWKDSREKFDEVLTSEHNKIAPSHKQISADYLEEYGTRVSQKFSAYKAKMKDLGEVIHLTLPRCSRSVNKESVDQLKQHRLFAQYQKLNAAAKAAKTAKAKKKK